MTITKKVPADEVQELVWDSVEDVYTGRSRWGIYIDSIIKDEDGSYWRVSWEDGATESQDYNSFSSWGGEPAMVTITKVVKKEVLQEVWVDADE